MPYRHVALRELTGHFMHCRHFCNARDLLRQHVLLLPYSACAETHGSLGICLTEILLGNDVGHKATSKRGSGARNRTAAAAKEHLETALTLQPSRYAELAYYVDLLLGAGDVTLARTALEDFCRRNPRMHAPHAALWCFLKRHAAADSKSALRARCWAASRALLINPTDAESLSHGSALPP